MSVRIRENVGEGNVKLNKMRLEDSTTYFSRSGSWHHWEYDGHITRIDDNTFEILLNITEFTNKHDSKRHHKIQCVLKVDSVKRDGKVRVYGKIKGEYQCYSRSYKLDGKTEMIMYRTPHGYRGYSVQWYAENHKLIHLHSLLTDRVLTQIVKFISQDV